MTEKEIQWLQVFIERPVEEVTGADVDHAHGIMDGILREGNGTVEFGGLEHKLLHDAGDKINRWNITRELRVQQERRHSAALWNTKERRSISSSMPCKFWQPARPCPPPAAARTSPTRMTCAR